MALEQELAQLITEQVDFIDDSLETPFEETLTAYGEAHSLALEIKNAAGTDDTQTIEIARGVLSLANAFGKNFKQLDDSQAETVRTAIRQIVVGANEDLVERFFDASLAVIVKAKNLNNVIDNVTAPEEEETEE